MGDARRPGRRNNAPIRPPRRPATSVPDLLFALATAAWTMALHALMAGTDVDQPVVVYGATALIVATTAVTVLRVLRGRVRRTSPARGMPAAG